MAFVSTFDHSKMNELQKHQERNKVLIMMAREQLMEDIDSIVESISCVYTDEHDIDWNTIEVSHEELTRMLCDAVCRNFPAQ